MDFISAYSDRIRSCPYFENRIWIRPKQPDPDPQPWILKDLDPNHDYKRTWKAKIGKMERKEYLFFLFPVMRRVEEKYAGPGAREGAILWKQERKTRSTFDIQTLVGFSHNEKQNGKLSFRKGRNCCNLEHNHPKRTTIAKGSRKKVIFF